MTAAKKDYESNVKCGRVAQVLRRVAQVLRRVAQVLLTWGSDCFGARRWSP